LNSDKNFKFPAGFPPDPGESGEETLEGIDSDHDGLRDDLQRWIYSRFPDDPKKRSVLRQLALTYQDVLFLKHDDKAIREYSERVAKASNCLFESFLDSFQANIEGDYIQAKVLNTRMRTERHLEVDSWSDGMILTGYPMNGTACEN
jgi:hypothetical protein